MLLAVATPVLGLSHKVQDLHPPHLQDHVRLLLVLLSLPCPQDSVALVSPEVLVARPRAGLDRLGVGAPREVETIIPTLLRPMALTT